MFPTSTTSLTSAPRSRTIPRVKEDVLDAGRVRQADDQINAANGILPTCTGRQDIFKPDKRVFTTGFKRIGNLDLNILPGRKDYIELRPRDQVLAVIRVLTLDVPRWDGLIRHLHAKVFDRGVTGVSITGADREADGHGFRSFALVMHGETCGDVRLTKALGRRTGLHVDKDRLGQHLHLSRVIPRLNIRTRRLSGRGYIRQC